MDHRVDVYAFGIMAYEMMTGSPPFTGRSPQAVLGAHLVAIPEPVTNHRPGLPPALAGMIMRCLQKHAADRPQTAGDLIGVLDTLTTPSGGTVPVIATTQPVRRPSGAAARPGRPGRRWGTILGVGAAAAAFGIWIWSSRPSGRTAPASAESAATPEPAAAAVPAPTSAAPATDTVPKPAAAAGPAAGTGKTGPGKAVPPSAAATDAVLLATVAHEQQQRLQREDADFLPYAAWFERLAPRYLDWLHGEEAAGVRVQETELELQAAPESLGARLKGRLDRLDVRHEAGARVWRIVDYKTSSAASLAERRRDPLEDTQLAFYAALLAVARPGAAGRIEALYLPLDDRGNRLEALPHEDVQASAEALLEGLAQDLARLRQGAPLPALGEGAACEHCNARGLCRRDHWAEVGPETP
jgi:RecB family exonuclease